MLPQLFIVQPVNNTMGVFWEVAWFWRSPYDRQFAWLENYVYPMKKNKVVYGVVGSTYEEYSLLDLFSVHAVLDLATSGLNHLHKMQAH